MKEFFIKIGNYFKNRFSQFNVHDYIIGGASLLISALGLYFSIGMSVSLSKGLTLFGDANIQSNEREEVGPTSSDRNVITLFWIITSLVIAFTIYYIFFYKIDRTKPTPKDVIDGVVEEIKEDNNNNNNN